MIGVVRLFGAAWAFFQFFAAKRLCMGKVAENNCGTTERVRNCFDLNPLPCGRRLRLTLEGEWKYRFAHRL
jgi:hypothetical protein